MDYMKVLLIYMAATLSLAVQSTTAPRIEPTPVPETAIVTEQGPAQLTPQVINGVAVTPGPETPTPQPVPEITPNKRYHNLASGAKGADVKKLQNRLIELGYLAEGSADGAYGRQTAAAVKKFQTYNGLTADGIAGRRTQTYLYENPDVLPFPKEEPAPADSQTPAETTSGMKEIPTEAPTDEPTEALTEAPAEEPTEVPTEAPTEVPTEAPTEGPTEAPTETPTEAPTEALTDAPTEVPTDAPTEIPTVETTDTPTPSPSEEPTRTPSAPVTSAPVTDTPAAEPTMYVEEIDPALLEFVEIEGSVAYNESGAPLEWIVLEDGVKVTRRPRLQQQGDRIRVSLDDLAACIDTWNLTDDGTVVLEAESHTMGLYNEDAGLAATSNGLELNPAPDDFVFGEGHFISAELLAQALGGEAEWDEEERTLMLRFPGK